MLTGSPSVAPARAGRPTPPAGTGWAARGLALAVLVVVAIATAFGAARDPLLTLAGAGAVAALAVIVKRPVLALTVLVASFYFRNYLDSGAGLITPAKGIGVLAVIAWAVPWLIGRRRVRPAATLWPVLGLILWLPASFTAAGNTHAALINCLRYLIFFTLAFLVVQVGSDSRRTVERIVDVAVLAAGVAGLIGIVSVLASHKYRSTGPIGDPNDFAFVLGATVPLMMYRIRWPGERQGRIRRVVASVCFGLAMATILGTLSRGGLVGLGSAGVWALATRRMRLRWGLAAAGVAGLLVVLAFVFIPTRINTSLQAKNKVAAVNVESRLYYWTGAVREFEAHPITGVGPGNFASSLTDVSTYRAAGTINIKAATTVDTTHNTYLNVLAELGGPGLALFATYLALSWRELRRRHRSDRSTDELQAALAAGFVSAVVAASFLTEQFFAPLWLLPALAVCVNRLAAPARADHPGT